MRTVYFSTSRLLTKSPATFSWRSEAHRTKGRTPASLAAALLDGLSEQRASDCDPVASNWALRFRRAHVVCQQSARSIVVPVPSTQTSTFLTVVG